MSDEIVHSSLSEDRTDTSECVNKEKAISSSTESENIEISCSVESENVEISSAIESENVEISSAIESENVEISSAIESDNIQNIQDTQTEIMISEVLYAQDEMNMQEDVISDSKETNKVLLHDTGELVMMDDESSFTNNQVNDSSSQLESNRETSLQQNSSSNVTDESSQDCRQEQVLTGNDINTPKSTKTTTEPCHNTSQTDDTTPEPSEPEQTEEKDMTEEEAQNILMKALKQIGPKIGKDFVLMFKDPNTSEVKEIASDKGKQFLEDNTDVVQKFSNICSDEISEQQNVRSMSSDDESMDATNSDTFIDDGTTKNDITEKSPNKTENVKKSFKNRSEMKPIKRAPRTTVIMKKLAKLEEKEKERLKNSVAFSCDHCSSKYGTAGNLNKHLKSKHNLGSVGKRGPKSKDTEDSSSDVTEFCENIDLQPTVEKEEASKSKKNVTLKMENCGDFETIVTVTNNVYTPSTVDTPERKRGRGRPPKHKSTDINDKDENVSTTKHIPASKIKKDIAEEPEDQVVTKSQKDPVVTKSQKDPVVRKSQKDPVVRKSPKSDNKATKTPAKPNYTEDDLACFIKTHDDENTEMNLECKLCLLRFSSQHIVWDHVLEEHRLNVEQCGRTLDLYPDTTKSSRFDSYIYVIEDDIEESIFPADLFSTTGRAGRKRTPSKKLLESQNACRKTSYVCKICHRKGTNKTSILKHMTKFHMDLLPASETKEDGEEEDMEEGEVEEEEEEEDIVNEEDDEDRDYKPSHEPVDEVRQDEDSVKIVQQKSIKRKKNVQTKSHPSKRNRNEGEDSDTVEKEVHMKKEVMPEINVNDQTEELKDDSNELEMKVECNLNEETGEMVPKIVKARNMRSRSKVFKKPPSYYVYCDHDESVIVKKSAHELPFCKSCERFKCLQCTLTFKKISHLNRHIRIIHNKEKKYKCTKCDARFTTNESLSYHKKWHTGVKDVECPHCEMKFLVQKNLRKHMNKHHPGLAPIRKKKANHCEICNSVFSRKERLEYHMLEKHPANNPDRECRICGQRFETDEECFSHANAHSDMAKVPVAKCPHCDLYCSSKNNLKRHVDRVHLNIKKYLCNECGKRFKGRDAFIYHVKRHADPYGRDFECHICNKEIATEKGLEIHLRTHTGLKPYVCETCGKGFAQKGNMQSHQAIHVDDRPFECEECHKTFKKKFDLYKHMKRHKIKHVHQTGDLSYLEGAGKVYECPLEDCKVLFCSTNDLKLHLRKHNNEKPYECIICFKTFAVKSRLVRHLRNVHTLHVPDSDLDSVKSTWAQKLETARMEYKEKKEKYQTVMIPQPSGEQIEVQIMTDEHEGVEDLLALSTPTTFSKEKEQEQTDESQGQQEIQFKIESAEEEGSNIQIINVRENSSGEVQIHTEEENIILDPAIIQTLLNSGQQTIYYYVDQ